MADTRIAFAGLAHEPKCGTLSGRWGSTTADLEAAADYMNLRVERNGAATI